MSLHDIAKHVQSQGRGEDTVLVHMTPKEVGGLQALAKANGGSLTRNPETGLYEAGFLSSVLPMVAGIAASAFLGPEMLPLVAGGIGLADYAMTGSLTQGLMAGLGAWSGYGLGEGIASAGAADLAQQGGDAAAKEFAESQAKAVADPEMWNQATTYGAGNASTQVANTAGLDAAQKETLQTALQNGANPAEIARASGTIATNPTATEGFKQGITSLSDIGSGIAAHPLAAAGAAMPLVSGALFKQPTVNAPTSTVSTVNQPLQRLSPNYQGIQPVPPNPHYQAQYPNYAQAPYDPRATGGTSYTPAVAAAEGGLMQGGPVNTDFMGGDMYPQSQIQRSYYATPTQMPTSAQQTMASYEPKTNPLTGELTANMAEGGLAGLASGGSSSDYIYHPSYTNYAQTPYNASSAPAYSGIPTPTRAPMGTTQNPGINGYAIDPTQMIGSPAYNQQQAAQQAQQIEFALGQGFAGGGILAFADGSKKPVGNKDMAAVDQYTSDAQSGGISEVMDKAQSGDWNAMLALQKLGYKQGQDFAGGGGISDLGSYSDGGRLLKGPGDGVSDSIPAQIGKHQPARLADGEFVIPARIVSELGNGSTDAGAKRLYAMMQRVQAKRKKSMGKGKFAVDSKAEKDLPA